MHGLVRFVEDSARVIAAMPGLSLHVGDLNEVDLVARLIRRIARAARIIASTPWVIFRVTNVAGPRDDSWLYSTAETA